MKTKTFPMLSAAVAALALLGSAQAQTATDTTPKGQLSTPNQDKGARPAGPSAENRADVKAAVDSASMAKGEQSTPNQGKKPPKRTGSEESRAEVRSEAAAANKAASGPKGQESVKDQNKGGVKQP
jgi:hypothetical protein